MHNSLIKTLAAAAVLALTACQTTPQRNADIEAARSKLESARSNAYVARSGALELERAQQALRRAETAWADDHDEEQTRHLAYLASQRAEIALAVGAQAQADERLQQAGAERDRVRLEARTREADARSREAAMAAANARAAQANAQSAQASAMNAQQAAQAQAERAAALERDLQALQARNTERGMLVTLGDVLFESGRATLQPGALRNVEQLATVLKQYPERRVLIEGYTDSVGSEEMNLQLSQRRAEAFRDALLARGVARERMDVRAHGESHPVADNNSAAGRQQNRRVEILFSDGQGKFASR